MRTLMRFIACLIAVGGALTGSGSRTLVAQQPIAADWPQFRGNPQLTGVASSTLPPALKVMWTFDAGDAIESSAAIADGTVYVGSAAGELVALDLQTGAVRWKYRTAEIGESSPAIANGVVYIGDLTGTFHAVDAKSGSRSGHSKPRGNPILAGCRRRPCAHRIGDRFLCALSAAKGAVVWKVEFQGYVHATPSVADGVAYISGCDETFRGIRIDDGREVLNIPIGAYMGASAALSGGAAYVSVRFENEVIGIDMKARKMMWAYRHPERLFPYLLIGAQSGPCDSGRPRQDGPRARRQDGQIDVDVHDECARRVVSSHCRQPRVHRIDRRPLVRAGCRKGTKLSEFDAGAAITASPAVANGRLVVGTHDGRLCCWLSRSRRRDAKAQRGCLHRRRLVQSFSPRLCDSASRFQIRRAQIVAAVPQFLPASTVPSARRFVAVRASTRVMSHASGVATDAIAVWRPGALRTLLGGALRATRRRRQRGASTPRLRQTDRNRLFGRAGPVFAFAHVLDFLPHEFSRLRGWCFPLTLRSPCPFNCLLFWHDVLQSGRPD